MRIELPENCLVAVIGATSSGKSTFAEAHFERAEVVPWNPPTPGSSEENQQTADTSDDVDHALHRASDRLKTGLFTVIDACCLRPIDRAPLVQLARRTHRDVVAIVLDPPLEHLIARNERRPDRTFDAQTLRDQHQTLKRGLRRIDQEGFARVYRLGDLTQIDAVQIHRTRLANDLRHESGPFDLIGDVHGCTSELRSLLAKLGWHLDGDRASHPDGRRVVFLGDLVDRGPDSLGALNLAMNMVADGVALCLPGNHEHKLARWLEGRRVRPSHGLDQTIAQIEALDDPMSFKQRAHAFIAGLPSHLRLDDGKLVVAHAGLKQAMHGGVGKKVRAFALYGQTTGETDRFGLPVRQDWAREYRGESIVAYGHTPVREAIWLNHTICLDTGCVFGGKLTALRWPERDLVEVPAERCWYPLSREEPEG